ncbi:hypothetical protein QFC19_002588 [Naganishia cerealis]|uniref:Uncharacterized protein n=1 Tax=Naganishia cerealis TaxID=610337 RepID=A0ACC2WAM3_9TREE|nr:hypothetical protein QFC19_002588 [Naganishia cerealis]
MQTDDASNLFQTDAALEKSDARRLKAQRASKIGDPIQLPSKVLALEVRNQDAWVAESGWVARQVDLATGKARRVYKGHQGPCTSLAFYDIPGSGPNSKDTILFTGSWDKTIKVWNTKTAQCFSTIPAHADFVKCLLVIPWLGLLVSGSSDKQINIWDITPLSAGSATPSEPNFRLRKLKTLKDHTRPVECFTFTEPTSSERHSGEATFYSADSMGVIRSWRIKREKENNPDGQACGFGGDVTILEKGTLEGHHTSVAEMNVGEGGLWSASVDNHVLFHSLARTPSPRAPIPIPHPDYVKSVLLLPTSFHPTAPLLLTGSVDEDIRVYDVSEILEQSGDTHLAVDGQVKAREIANVKGHFGEVSALRCWIKDGDKGKEPWVVSASLDATLRRWSMKDILDPPPIPVEDEKEKETSLMTADEERELAELLGSDDEQDL